MDGWLDFCWKSLEVPVQTLGDNSVVHSAKSDIETALAILEDHVQNNQFLVGDGITLQDISAAGVLHKALSLGMELKHVHVGKWYEFMKERFCLQNLSLSRNEMGETRDRFLNTSGVSNSIYERRRVRIKDVLADDGSRYMRETITVTGWARSVRNARKGKLLFSLCHLNYNSRHTQCNGSVAHSTERRGQIR